MHAVLPWPWEALTSAHQEPNCSFGGHALTVSLWKRFRLRLTELCSEFATMGALVEHQPNTRVSSGSKKSVAYL